MADDGRYEALTAAGIEAYDAKDRAHWTLGYLAAQVEIEYGSASLAIYARDIQAESARLAEYRTVWRFYEFSAPADFSERYANLRYTHARDAMRLGSRDDALDWLEMCSGEGMSVEAARVKLRDRLGKPAPPRKLLDMVSHQADILSALRDIFRGAPPAARYHVVVREAIES